MIQIPNLVAFNATNFRIITLAQIITSLEWRKIEQRLRISSANSQPPKCLGTRVTHPMFVGCGAPKVNLHFTPGRGFCGSPRLEAAPFRRQMMLKSTKIILLCIDYCSSNLRRLAKLPLGCAMILGFFLFNASSAHAIPVRADLNYLQSGGSGNTLAGEAFFDTAPLTGIGRENVFVDAFNFLFSDFGLRSAIIDPPSLNFVANFRDGEFINVGAAPQFFTPDSALFTFIPRSVDKDPWRSPIRSVG